MISGLNHINLRAPTDMLIMLRDFYRDVLGLEQGFRPNFGTSGYWLYAGDQPVLHLSEQLPNEPQRTHVNPAAPTTFDHTAFSGTDAEGTASKLRAHGVKFTEVHSARALQHQFFFQDPAGNGVEINFPF
ncbi:VOC family protein [Roseateles sp. NT4]|uniref:VOC family protein n=1 Tax=Roseateles sp. NT4 TaxID=3453715 RepID=UPI003EECC417